MTVAPLSMPTPEEVLAYGGDPNSLKPTLTWWRFWLGLYRRSQADVPFLVSDGLTALGTTQGTALALTSDWNEITGGGLDTGVELSNFGAGFASWVWNTTGTAKKVYPPLGAAIDALGTNAAYSLAAGKAQVFSQITASQFRSLQLG